MSEMNDTLVLGIGNLVLQDEGFGIHVIRELERMREEEGADGTLHGVDLLDGGCAGLHLMGYIQNYYSTQTVPPQPSITAMSSRGAEMRPTPRSISRPLLVAIASS